MYLTTAKTVYSTTITYPYAFSYAPRVVVSCNYGGIGYIRPFTVVTKNVTKTGFTIECCSENASSDGCTVEFYWIAMLPEGV